MAEGIKMYSGYFYALHWNLLYYVSNYGENSSFNYITILFYIEEISVGFPVFVLLLVLSSLNKKIM